MDPTFSLGSLSTGGGKNSPRVFATPLAKKYGHPSGTILNMSHRILKHTGKSGITPLSPFRNIMWPRPTYSQRRKLRLHWYQRHRFFGFTAKDLENLAAMSAFEGRDLFKNLSSPLHPIFERCQWESRATLPMHRGFIPMLGGYPGFWCAENDLVWDLLQQPLILASHLLMNNAQWSWWDALLEGKFDPIPDSRKPPDRAGEMLLSFRSRDNSVRSLKVNMDKIHQRLHDMAGRIRFGLYSGYNSIDTNCAWRTPWSCGETQPSLILGYVRVFIAIEMLQPLLRDDMTNAERITITFRIATTIIHEMAHAAWCTVEDQHAPIRPSEPYFEDEPLSELGWSLEDKLWGGEGKDIVHPSISQGSFGFANMGIFATNWFTKLHENYGNNPIVLNHVLVPRGQIDPFYTYEYWPITYFWQYSLLREEFWFCNVRRFGKAATQMGPKTLGTRIFSHDREEAANFWFIQRTDLDLYMTEEFIDDSMTMAEKARRRFENQRRRMAADIMQACQLKRDEVDPNQIRDGVVEVLEDPPPEDDNSSEDEASAPADCQPSPLKDSHYQSIASYLLKNRGPLELALDTMDFDIPEATLYRYIVERGGLIISPRDFRSFLIQADKKGEYFEWWLEGWTGMVRRREKGWPDNPRDTRDYPVPPAAGTLSAQDQTVIDTVMQNNQFLLNVYTYWHGFRDMDYETLRCFINKEVQDKWHIKAGSMEDLVRFFHGNGGGVYLMHGPKGIARLKVVIPQWIKDTVDHAVGDNPAVA